MPPPRTQLDHEMFLTRPPAAHPPYTSPDMRNGRHPRDAARFDGVREGGVEPPRPFGHWNLNPARLPIPPPAHWVCLPVLAPWGLAPSDIENISTLAGVDSHPFPADRLRPAATPRPPPRGPHGRPSTPVPRPAPPRTSPREPPADPGLVSRRSPSRPCRGHDRPTYQPRTGTTRLPRRRTESTAGCGTLVRGPLYDPWQNDGHRHGRRSSKRSLGGNFVRRRHPAAGRTGGTSRSGGAWIRSVSSTR